MINLNLITVGSKWFGSTRDQVFVVTGLIDKDEDMWVTYTNSNNHFSCRLDAFKQRFTEIQNEN